ncbi:MAG: hypothetical protein M3340_01715 [Actinomycetota bacterium]|nr:hypothetical protein [Actinomycetota bacterium]
MTTFPTTDGRVPFPGPGDQQFMREEVRDTATSLALTNLNGDDVCRDDAVLHDLSMKPAEWREQRVKEETERKRADLRGTQKVVGTRAEEEQARRKRLELEIEAEEEKAKHHREEAKKKAEERKGYSLIRRSYDRATDVHKATLAVVAGVDITLIGLALMVLPGTDIQHWLTATFLGALFAAFGHVIGELVGGTVREVRKVNLPQLLLFAIVGLLVFAGVLAGVALSATTVFRNFGLEEQAADDIIPPDFLGWIQALAVFVASLSAALWRYGADGRDRRDEERDHLAQVDQADANVGRLRGQVDESFKAEYGAKTAAIRAAEEEGTLDDRSAARCRQEILFGEYLWAFGRSIFQGVRYRLQAFTDLAEELGLVEGQRKREQRAKVAAALTGLVVAISVHVLVGLDHLPTAGIGLVAAGIAYFLAMYNDAPKPVSWPTERRTPEAQNAGLTAPLSGAGGARTRPDETEVK